ncbi:TPA: hypothetical protein ACSTJZ_001388 [Serratia fonticola]
MIEAFKAVKAYQDKQSLSQSEPVAEVVSKFGDPESFGEREIRVLADLQKIAYGTKLFCAPPPALTDSVTISKEDWELICQAIGGHAAILQFMTLGRHDLALEEASKWVDGFDQAAQVVSTSDQTDK